MSETTPKTNLTIKAVHFPKVILAAAGALWGLAVVGAILETIFRTH